MKKIFIKYNPYQVTTEITIDDKPLKKNSKLNVPDLRLQEWVDNLVDILIEECSTKDFEITFHGTVLDFEDVVSAVEDAKNKGINISLKHIPAKEVKDKEQAIAEVFEEIQNGPFEDLKSPDVVKAFKMASSSDFEVSVVATMSAGKSTLINSLLGERLMPAKQEACTAIITEIKDNDSDHFTAKVYDKKGELIETQSELSYEIMERLNSNKEVSKICAEGNIPFVGADDVSLVLVDTPGPNNSRDPEHRIATYRMLSDSSKTLVLYIMNGTQLAVDDDNKLLEHVAKSMKVGGKQSRDRFIFVVNKLDEFKKDQDNVHETLEKVKTYLSDHGIENPNIYPASALTALNIRTILTQSDDDDDDEVYEAKGKVRKFNKNEEMHFEDYAPLSTSVKGMIANRLAEAKLENDDKEQALIHSGIVPIEEAIRMYVLKYAKTAKIKNIVDTFISRLESEQSFEKTKQEISLNKKEKDAISKRIKGIEEKLKNGEDAKRFKSKIYELNYDEEIAKSANEIIKNAQEKITGHLKNPNMKMSHDEAKDKCAEFAKFADEIQTEVQLKLEDLIEKKVRKNACDLLDQYKRKLADLVDEISVGDIEINPLEIMKGGIPTNTSSIISDSIKTQWVKIGEKWIPNEDRKWYKPWTWLQEKGHYKDIMEEQEYVDGRQLAEKFFAPIQEQLYENSLAAQKHAKNAAERIRDLFSERFDELDLLLKTKLGELKACATDEENAAKKLEESKSRLEWLNNIQSKVNSILEI